MALAGTISEINHKTVPIDKSRRYICCVKFKGLDFMLNVFKCPCSSNGKVCLYQRQRHEFFVAADPPPNYKLVKHGKLSIKDDVF